MDNTNENTAAARIPGLAKGRMILINAPIVEHPSIMADSSNSGGRSSKNPLRIQITKGKLKAAYKIINPPRATEYYIDGYLKTIKQDILKNSHLKIVLDYNFSPASTIFPKILGELGLEVISINAYVDPNRITKSEQEFKKSLGQLSDIVTTLQADIGFLIDNGAEKVFIVDDKGKIIPDDIALCTIVELITRIYNKGKIIVPVHTTSVVEEITKNSRKNIQVERCRMLPRYVVEASHKEDVIFVGDNMGGFIFPEFQPAFDAMYAIGKILEMLSIENTKISRLVRYIPSFEVLHKKLPCSWNKKGLIIRKLIEETKDKKIELIDGIKIYFEDTWILLRPDSEEPCFHIWVESKRERLASDLLEKYSKKILDLQR